jgi:hypothetical protein
VVTVNSYGSLVFVAHDAHFSFLFWKPYSVEIFFHDVAYVCYINNEQSHDHLDSEPQQNVTVIHYMNISSYQPRYVISMMRRNVVNFTEYYGKSTDV